MIRQYFISIGSNIGDRKKNIVNAINLIRNQSTIDKVSSLYLTEPYGIADQADFYNCIISVFSELSVIEFMTYLLDVEKKMGRIRKQKNGPRTIDLDIIAVDDCVMNTDIAIIPHPRFHERKFVLEPFNEIYPDFVVLDKPIHQYLKDCKDGLSIKKIESEFNVDPI